MTGWTRINRRLLLQGAAVALAAPALSLRPPPAATGEEGGVAANGAGGRRMY